MGIFSTNSRVGFGNYTVEAAQGYDGAGAGYRILAECYQNDMALFNGMIEQDFAEAYGYVNESTLIQEGAIADFFKKVKDMFLKLIEKIKGLINSFMTKVMATLTRDNKKLVEKYKKQVNRNIQDGRLKDMAFKMHEEVYNNPTTFIQSNKDAMTLKKSESATGLMISKVEFSTNPNKSEEENLNILQDALDSEINNGNLFRVVSGFDEDEFETKFKEKMLGDENEFEGYDSNFNTKVQKLLTDSNTTMQNLKAVKTNTENICKKNISDLDKLERKIDALSDDKKYSRVKMFDKEYKPTESDEGMGKQVLSKAQAVVYQAALIDQKVLTNSCTYTIDITKTAIKECRAVFIKAASARSVKNEDAVLFDIIDEAVSYDVDMMLEGRVDSFEDFSDEI